MTPYIQELHKNLSADKVLIFDSQNRVIILLYFRVHTAQRKA